MDELTPKENNFLLYSASEGDVRLEVLLNDEMVWLTQKSMQELFGRSKSTISEHISNIFKEEELVENQVVRKFRTTADDGKNYETTFYNLDVIISAGYRVKSLRGIQFRIWATQTHQEFLCSHTKQVSLCYYRKHSRRNYLPKSRQRKRKHGTSYLFSFT